MTGTALVVSHSTIPRDPRVRREAEWLAGAGWVVDTFGFGDSAIPGVRTHFAVRDEPGWLGSKVAKGLVHTLLPHRRRFRALMESRVPEELTARRGVYDLIVVNDIDWLPWIVGAGRSLLAPGAGSRIVLDLHEWHPWESGEHLDFTSRLLRGYQEWIVGLIADPVFHARATVADGLADLYAERFGMPRPSVIRNSPGFVELAPSPIDPARIELAYHGSADVTRGLGLLPEVMDALDDRFRLNLMLVDPQSGIDELRRRTAHLGDRVAFHDPVAMPDIPARINEWDLELIFYPPTRTNLRFSLPNKLFEAVQGRIGLVIGHSPEMQRLVEEHGFGLVVDGWTAADLAAALTALTAEDVTRMKAAADRAATSLSAEHERTAFLTWIGETA